MSPTLKLCDAPLKRPEHMSLYPIMDSVADAISYIEHQVPIDEPNHMFSLLMMFQNTVLEQLNQQDKTADPRVPYIRALTLCVKALDQLLPQVPSSSINAQLLNEALITARPLLK